MKIETVLIRVGGSHHEIGGTDYHFKPQGNDKRHIADVTNPEHIKRFLSIVGFQLSAGESAPLPLDPAPALDAVPPAGPAITGNEPVLEAPLTPAQKRALTMANKKKAVQG